MLPDQRPQAACRVASLIGIFLERSQVGEAANGNKETGIKVGERSAFCVEEYERA